MSQAINSAAQALLEPIVKSSAIITLISSTLLAGVTFIRDKPEAAQSERDAREHRQGSGFSDDPRLAAALKKRDIADFWKQLDERGMPLPASSRPNPFVSPSFRPPSSSHQQQQLKPPLAPTSSKGPQIWNPFATRGAPGSPGRGGGDLFKPKPDVAAWETKNPDLQGRRAGMIIEPIDREQRRRWGDGDSRTQGTRTRERKERQTAGARNLQRFLSTHVYTDHQVAQGFKESLMSAARLSP